MSSIRATAPAKTILLGEHAVNRGQTALAVSVGLYATCTLNSHGPRSEMGRPGYYLHANGQEQVTTRATLLADSAQLDSYLARNDYEAIRQRVADDFFAPAKYVLAGFAETLPDTLSIHMESEIPHGSGLGSGGAIFVALASALAQLIYGDVEAQRARYTRQIAQWALRGDIIAHGGTASGLDTQTSLYGGTIRYTAERQGEPISCAPGLALVIGNSNVYAPTSGINAGVRDWLNARPARIHFFQEIGLLSRQAEHALREGDWLELGHLINLNQLLLERIGVSCPELQLLNEAALDAGALGAKLSGSGGGGIMFALVTPDKIADVTRAITSVGGTPIVAPIGVPGVSLHTV